MASMKAISNQQGQQMDPVVLPIIMIISSLVSAVGSWVNQSLSRKQQEEIERQRRADRYGPEERALRWEVQLEQARNTAAINEDQHRKRLIEDWYRILLQRRAALGADILLPGTWWDNRRPDGSGPLVVVDIGRTKPADINGPTTLDAPLDFLTRSLKEEYAADLTPRLDVIFESLCIDSDGTARGFHYTELRGHPAILVYGKSAGNRVYIDAVFSRSSTTTQPAPGNSSGRPWLGSPAACAPIWPRSSSWPTRRGSWSSSTCSATWP